jgi:hypothetical protein
LWKLFSIDRKRVKRIGENVKTATKILLAATSVLTAVAQVPVVKTAIATFVTGHPGLASAGAYLLFIGGVLYHPAVTK